MNSEQFEKFLQLQASQQKQISDILQILVLQQQTATASTSTPTTTSGTESPSASYNNDTKNIYNNFKGDKFNPNDTAVENFIDYFETKCGFWGEDARNIQKDLLFSCLSPETFHDIKVALTPHFDNSTYADIRSKLLDLYRVKRTRYRALSDFWTCIRAENEPMEHYANRLKEISKDCGYDDSLLERQLRDRFATGLNHQQLQIDLKQKWPDLQEKIDGKVNEITFAQIFSVAQSRERAEGDVDTCIKVNKVSKNAKPRQQTTTPRTFRSHQCLRCGQGERHPLSECPAKNHTCRECNTHGHYEDCCIKSGKAYLPSRNQFKRSGSTKRNKLHKLKNNERDYNRSETSETEESDDDSDTICQIHRTKKDSKKIDVLINDTPCTLDWDPGSVYSIISSKFWKRIGAPPLTKAPGLRAYGNIKLKPKGLTDVTVRIQGEEKILPVVVMKSADPMLFGLQWSEMFQMEFPKPVYSVKNTHYEAVTLKLVLEKYKSLFDDKLGKVKDYKVNIHIKPGAEPKHIPARTIKFSMKKNIESELERLVQDGIITQIDPNLTPILWATPTVNVVKPNGQIRICGDFHSLTGNRVKWRWTDTEKIAFEQAKSLIARSTPLIAFNDKRQLYLACDASEKGVGAVLFHTQNDSEQPIAFASRKLRPAESKYSVIDREALAILFGIRKFDQYLRGLKFTLVTDHKPLIHVLGTQRNLPKLVNNRLVRWALIIGSYNYDIIYTKGGNNLMADCLSRMPNPEEMPSKTELAVHRIEARLQSAKLSDLTLSEDTLKEETRKDPILRKVAQFLKTGWREHEYSSNLKPYARKRDEISLENKVVMWQGRIIVPEKLRSRILKYLHCGHPGISAMRALSRYYVWWPSLEADIDSYVKSCRKCQENRPNNPELPIFSWSIPDKPWERLHVDFAGPFEGSHWLVLSDAFSKWIEVKPMTKITTSKLCDELDTIFTTFGLPQFIVSDNGPQFTSQEFQIYCQSKGIKHIKSSPYNPRTNGLAERLVRTFKSRMSSSTESLKKRLENFLFSYRITPHTTTGKSPSLLMFGRQLACVLDNVRPNAKRSMQYRQIQANIDSEHKTPEYKPGDPVYVRARDQHRWEPATISRRTHRYSYIINTPTDVERRYHADHIRPRLTTPVESTSLANPQNGTPAQARSPILENIPETVEEACPVLERTRHKETNSRVTSQQASTPQAFSTPMEARRSKRTIRPPRRLIDEM